MPGNISHRGHKITCIMFLQCQVQICQVIMADWNGVQTTAVLLCAYLVLRLEPPDKNFQQWLFCTPNMTRVPRKLLTIYKVPLLNGKTMHLGGCGYKRSTGVGERGGWMFNHNKHKHTARASYSGSQQLFKWWTREWWIISLSLRSTARQGWEALCYELHNKPFASSKLLHLLLSNCAICCMQKEGLTLQSAEAHLKVKCGKMLTSLSLPG